MILNFMRSLTKSLALALWRAPRSLSKQTFRPSPGQSIKTVAPLHKAWHRVRLGRWGDIQLPVNMTGTSYGLPLSALQEHAGDIVVDDAMAIEEPDEPDLDDEARSIHPRSVDG